MKNDSDTPQEAAGAGSSPSPCCASLMWHPGPANGGGGTAQETAPNNDPWWRDGDMLLVIVDRNDGPELSVVRVHADGPESLDFSNAATGDFDFGWTDREISWWARLDGILPHNAGAVAPPPQRPASAKDVPGG